MCRKYPVYGSSETAEPYKINFHLLMHPLKLMTLCGITLPLQEKELENTVKLCIKYGCPCEFVLKDISTVSKKPENLIVWSRVVSEVLDEYYGR